ncbi:hypothetical protein DPMN_101391 [Dreissena polymorpha]|uniref:Uncharacterized protein n=1 Tax=Dreissena polymorpha TaxID=45954 RepID=A0A9D4LJV3_DREPO|nr:hypothetical protein DPMN_101391 [Dreissena polymorpha]
MTATLFGPLEHLLAPFRRRKLTWFGHVTRHDCLCTTFIQSRQEGVDDDDPAAAAAADDDDDDQQSK